MADSLIPISDEQAKLGQDAVKAISGLAGWIADVLGDSPRDLIGLLVGDKIKAKRIERIGVLWQKTRERLRDRGIGIDPPDSPSLRYALPILEAAADEENDELQDLWSRLLAAAMDPSRRDTMRQSFIQVVKQMDPMDALVLKAIPENGHRDMVVRKLKCPMDEVLVSFEHLAQLDCISFSDSTGPRILPYLKPFGTLLMQALRD